MIDPRDLNELDKEDLELWVKELKSGSWPKAEGRLHFHSVEEFRPVEQVEGSSIRSIPVYRDYYCVLGVLGKTVFQASDEELDNMGGNLMSLGIEGDWASLVAQLNDYGISLEDIGKIVEWGLLGEKQKTADEAAQYISTESDLDAFAAKKE